MKASLSASDHASFLVSSDLRSLVFQHRVSKAVPSTQSRLRDFMEFQSHCLTAYLPPNKQSMPYDINRLDKRILKQSKSDVWAKARQRDLLVTFASFGKSYTLSRAERSLGIQSHLEETKIPEEPKNNPILRLPLGRQKGKGP